MKKIVKILSIICIFAFIASFSISTMTLAEKIEWIDISWNDSVYEEKDLPDGVKGYSYPVPNCVAVDNNGNIVLGMETSVYDPSNNLVPIVDNRFNTQESGIYKVVYEVENNGKTAEKTVEINVVESCSIEYTVNENIKSEYFTGEVIELPVGEMTGGSGLLSLDCIGSVNGQNIVINDFGGVRYIQPTQAGEYNIKFILSDYVGQIVEKQVNITVIDTVNPIMIQPSIRKINRVGEKVDLPVVDAVVYKNNKSYFVPVQVFLDEVDITDDMSYVATEGLHEIKYLAKGIDGVGQTIYTYQVKVIDVANEQLYNDNYHYINNYMSLDSLNTKFIDGSCFLIADGKESVAKMELSAKISNKAMSVGLMIDKNSSNFDCLECVFVDSCNSQQKVVIKFKSVAKKTEIYINEIYDRTIDYSFESDSAIKALNFEIDPLTGEIKGENDIVFGNIKTYANGKEFTGFDSGFAYFSMNLLGIYGESAVKFSKIASMNITEVNSEVSDPMYISGGLKDVMSVEINEKFIIPYIEFFDPFDQNVTLKLSVFSPSGEIIYNDIMTKDLSFVATEFGTYSIEYMAEDSFGNYSKLYALVYVMDREFPSISVENFALWTRVGETLNLPEPKIDDNSGASNLATFVYVITENSQREVIRNFTYEFKQKGDYVIKYVVMDEAGNYSVIRFNIKCR